jgi:hypothetical protein
MMDNFLREHELELDLIDTKETFDEIHGHHDYDVIVEHDNKGITMFGSQSNYLYDGLVTYLIEHNAFDIDYEYILDEEGDELL